MKQEGTLEELEKYKLAVDNSTNHITFSDAEGIAIYANQAVENITGFSQDEIIGKKVGTDSLWGGQMPREFYENLWHTLKEEKKPFEGEFKNKRKDGSVFYSRANIFPIIDEKGDVDFFVEVHRDITAEKQLEKAKTDFLSLAVHQLQTPLTIVKWSLEMLGQYSLTDQQHKFLGDANLANERMIQLINELLNVTRIELGMFEPERESINLEQMISEVKKEFLTLAKAKNIDIQENYAMDISEIESDKALMKSMLRILISNAIKYTPKNGKITLEAKLIKDKEVEIIVSDTGFGVSKDDKKQIFNKMFRSDEARRIDPQGIGVGLFVVSKFLNSIDGSIWCESPSSIGDAKNPGTQFHVVIPLRV